MWRPPACSAADDRVGFWTLHYTEVGSRAGALNSHETNRQVRIIHRWKLEKQTPPPGAPQPALSPPVQPIIFHIDPSVPPRWRAAVRRGVENWNAAFETAGFSGAVLAVLPGETPSPAPAYSSYPPSRANQLGVMSPPPPSAY